MKWLVGVDEAGRGPLAGPVAVGVVKIVPDFDWKLLPGVGDSKRVLPKNREVIFGRAQALRTEGILDFTVVLESARVIDRIGVVAAIKRAQAKAFKKLLLAPAISTILLDGSLSAPPEYTQTTIIRGDATEPVIGLASILAKVTRDEYMRRVALRPAYTPYNFATHKGYGTKAHRAAVAHYGLSPEHRVTYCQNIKMWDTL